MDTSNLKGDKQSAAWMFFGPIVIALILIKFIVWGLLSLLAALFWGAFAMVITGVLIVGGYWLYRIEEWAFKTLFLNADLDFPDSSIWDVDPHYSINDED